jgi:hypothetical protein
MTSEKRREAKSLSEIGGRRPGGGQHMAAPTFLARAAPPVLRFVPTADLVSFDPLEPGPRSAQRRNSCRMIPESAGRYGSDFVGPKYFS